MHGMGNGYTGARMTRVGVVMMNCGYDNGNGSVNGGLGCMRDNHVYMGLEKLEGVG